jgi:hypothetical protein
MLQLARLLLLIVAAATGAAAATAQQVVKQVYLIQNSGWMEPFYADPQSPFKTAVEYTITSTAGASPIVVATFNQGEQVPGEVSPHKLYAGAFSPPGVSDAMHNLSVGKKANGAYADTDFAGALLGAITRPDMLAGQSGIIWIFTNNMNSPDNSQDVLDNTLGFYRELQTSAAISRIVAFPVPMKLKGERYDTTGFILYGIAYGEPAAQALAAQVADGAPLRQAFPAAPGLLKPLDQQAVTLEFDAAPVNGISVYYQDGVLFFSGLSAEQPSPVTLSARVRSLQDTLVIEQANVSARWLVAGAGDRPSPPVSATINPAQITGLGARQVSAPLQITVTFPPIAASGVMDEIQHIDGYMEVDLTGLRYGLDPAFASNAADVFGGPEMVEASELFNAHKKVTQAATRIPIRMTVEFSPWPLAMLIGSILAGLALLGTAAWWLFARRERTVMIDGTRMKVRVSSFGSTIVLDGLGRTWRVQASPFGVKGTLT